MTTLTNRTTPALARSWSPRRSSWPATQRPQNEPDPDEVRRREQAEQDDRAFPPVLTADPETSEPEQEHHRQRDRGQREHDPHPPVAVRVEPPALPGAHGGQQAVRGDCEDHDRRRLPPRVALRLLEPIVAHR